MIKRIVAAFLSIVTFSTFIVGFASGSESETGYEVLISADFDDNTVENLKDYGLSYDGGMWEYATSGDGYCLSYPHSNTKGALVGGWFGSAYTQGRFCISYDLMCTAPEAYKTFQFMDSSLGWFASTTDNYMPIRFLESGDIRFYRDRSVTCDVDLSLKYTTDEWYNVKIWVDMDNREQMLYINDSYLATFKLPEVLREFKGFGIQVSPNGALGDTATFIDNIKFIKEKANFSQSFNPVFTDYAVSEDIIGNNFFLDKKPQFELTFRNRLSEEKSYNVVYEVKTKEGESVWKSEAEELCLSGDGEEYKTLIPDFNKFGVLSLEITFLNNEIGSFKKVIPFTYSNRDTKKQLNYSMGAATHIIRGRGKADDIIPLMSYAGIGVIRGEDFWWDSFEATPGVYELTDDMKNIVSLLKEYDMKYMQIVYGTHNSYIGEDKSNPADEMYEKLSVAITELLNQTDGTIGYLENWNEYHSSDMSGKLAGSPQVSAKLHKAIWDGAQNSINKPKVLAFNENSWGLYENGERGWLFASGLTNGVMNKTLKIMNGEPFFDAISFHPYSTSRFEKSDNWNTMEQDIKTILKNNGYDQNTPIVFSEIGWYDTGINDDAKKADYIVGANANIAANDIAMLTSVYNFADYAEFAVSDPAQSSFGMVESYSKSAEEVPYLGKESFIAVSYYNSLVSERENAEVIDTGIKNSYCYKFTGNDNNDVIMLGLYEGTPKTIAVKCNSKTATIADIYGNEETVNTIDGVLNIELKPQAQYIKGDFADDFLTQSVTAQKPYAIVKGTAEPGEELVLAVYKEGKDSFITEEDEISDVIYYYAQQKADEAGSFCFALPADLNIDVNLLAKVTGKYTSMEFHIYSHGNALVVYRTEQKNDGSVAVYQTASILSDKYTDCDNAVVVGAVYNNGVLKNCAFSKASIENGNIMVLDTKVTAQSGDEVKGFLWKDTESIIPIGKSIVLY